jgi:hypothetical protein
VPKGHKQDKQIKEHKQEKKAKKVSFADPIATELKAPKTAIPDDSIMFIKGTFSTSSHLNETVPSVATCPTMDTSTLVACNFTPNIDTESCVTTSRIVVPAPLPHVTMTEPISADISTGEGTALEQCMVPGNNIPSENVSGAEINLQGTAAEQPTNNAMYVSLAAVPDKDMDELRREQPDASKEKNMELLLDHLQEFLVSPPASAVIGVENHHNSSIRGSLVLDEIDQSCMIPNAEDCQPPVNTPIVNQTANCTVGNT